MAVPINWNHHVSPNLKMLFVMMSDSSCMMNLIGGRFGFSCRYLVMYFWMVGKPSNGSMFVYMEVASDVNSLALEGRDGSDCKEVIMSSDFST